MTRIYKSVLGIPIWLITGTSIFIIFSILYDAVVGDRNVARWVLLGASGLILFLTLVIHSIKLKTVGRIARRQLGG